MSGNFVYKFKQQEIGLNVTMTMILAPVLSKQSHYLEQLEDEEGKNTRYDRSVFVLSTSYRIINLHTFRNF